MKAAKSSKLRLPQRSDAVAGDETEGMQPIPVAQKKKPAARPLRQKRKAGRPAKKI